MLAGAGSVFVHTKALRVLIVLYTTLACLTLPSIALLGRDATCRCAFVDDQSYLHPLEVFLPDIETIDCFDEAEAASLAEHVIAKPSPRANLADRHVGTRIRERRIMLGLSQQQLAVMIGVTYQQAHKYERGLNRISAGRLYDIAQVLNVPISWFFEGMEIEAATGEMNPRQRMCLELARNFALIDNLKHQEALSMMARALAHGETVPPEPDLL
jgi:transcriptional regulator with XRE-family HTH domain